MQVCFLGCGDDHGVPRVGCECEVCRSAHSPESHNYRTGPSIALRYGPSYAERVVLIDTAPEFRLQTTRLGLQHFDALLLTHAHDAHILGLSALARVQRERRSPLLVHAPAQVIDAVRDRFGYLWTDKTYRRVMQFEAVEGPRDLWGLGVRPLRTDHGMGGTSHGYLLSLGERRLAYVPDMLRDTAEVRRALENLDLLVLGTSHYYEGIEMWKRSIMDIMAASELIRTVSPSQAILTHLSHTIDYAEVSAEISARLAPNISLAHDGLIVEVQE